MEINENIKQPVEEEIVPPHRGRVVKLMLNAVIVVMLSAIGYFSYAFISRYTDPPVIEKQQSKPPRVIQLDVLNGCGVKGVGAKFTNYLRTNGFDVVEMKNYKTFNISQTLVVDRIGDLGLARRVAATLGVTDKNVVQQINPDYFVDVSVIIGKDYSSLPVSR